MEPGAGSGAPGGGGSGGGGGSSGSMLGSPGTPGPTPTPGPVSRLPFNTGFNSMYPSIPQPSSMADAYRYVFLNNSIWE